MLYNIPKFGAILRGRPTKVTGKKKYCPYIYIYIHVTLPWFFYFRFIVETSRQGSVLNKFNNTFTFALLSTDRIMCYEEPLTYKIQIIKVKVLNLVMTKLRLKLCFKTNYTLKVIIFCSIWGMMILTRCRLCHCSTFFCCEFYYII